MKTAEEFLKDFDYKNQELGTDINYPMIERCMIEFAKLHVEKALENAYDCHSFKGWTNSDDESVHKELFVKNIMSRQSIK